MFTFAALIISVLHHCVGINIILCQLISKVIVSTLTKLQHKMHYNWLMYGFHYDSMSVRLRPDGDEDAVKYSIAMSCIVKCQGNEAVSL